MEKIIPNSGERYAVTDDGNLISYCFNKDKSPYILKTSLDECGYPYRDLSIPKGSKPIRYLIKDLVWDVFNDFNDRTGYFVENVDNNKLNNNLSNLKLSPIGKIPNNFEDLEDYEASTTQPELDEEQEFLKKIMSMSEINRQKYLEKRNRFEDIKSIYRLKNFMRSVGYDENEIDEIKY